MPIEITQAEKASGYYTYGEGNDFLLVGLSARHYIATRVRDGVSVHVTGDDAANIDRAHTVAFASDSPFETDEAGSMFALMLDMRFIQPALKTNGFIGVGLIDTLSRPCGRA